MTPTAKHTLMALGLAMTLLPAAAFADTGFSGWRPTDGDGQLQYRWRNYTGSYRQQSCEIQVRNLTSSDDHEYKISSDLFDETNGDYTRTTSASFNDGYIKIIDEDHCDQVKGVTTELR